MKYDANGLDLHKFKGIQTADELYIEGWDTFYSNPHDSDSFLRYRSRSGENELTFKRKLIQKNSIIRTEINIALSENNSDNINKFCEELGYKYNTKIHKVAYVYLYEDYNICYYFCADDKGKSLDSFIEIELAPDINWRTKKNAMETLKKLEKRYELIGLSPKLRVKKSLFELYRK